MRTVEITKASLEAYEREHSGETWVLTRRGRPVAAVVPMRAGMDAEAFSLSHHPDFIEVVNRSWANYKAKGGMSGAEARRQLRVEKPARTPRRRAR